MLKTNTATAATLAFLLGFLSLGLSACEKEREKGPAEKLGAKIDDAAREVKSEAREVRKDIRKAIDEAEEEIEDEIDE